MHFTPVFRSTCHSNWPQRQFLLLISLKSC
ncbi:hypothetical protein E2C01_061993 [Portunus trituberculatus]|uniref:Uncharacterized protein n=1 Tax=Portunus trituberculatus TaxID=210409 RepID=A0A5B7HEQ5_PORTR|nr:hypothetical protein [Portunus trituberculatus]